MDPDPGGAKHVDPVDPEHCEEGGLMRSACLKDVAPRDLLKIQPLLEEAKAGRVPALDLRLVACHAQLLHSVPGRW